MPYSIIIYYFIISTASDGHHRQVPMTRRVPPPVFSERLGYITNVEPGLILTISCCNRGKRTRIQA